MSIFVAATTGTRTPTASMQTTSAYASTTSATPTPYPLALCEIRPLRPLSSGKRAINFDCWSLKDQPHPSVSNIASADVKLATGLGTVMSLATIIKSV